VIVAGYGEAAHRLVRVLAGSKIPFLITTLSPVGAASAEAEGYPVLRGDATRLRTLQRAGIERAKMLVVADDEPAIARRVVAVARSVSPFTRIVARTRYRSEAEPLLASGADRVVADELEGIVALFSEGLHDYRVPAEEIQRYEEALRGAAYRALSARAPEVHPCTLGENCQSIRTVLIRAGSPAVGRTWNELGLQGRLRLLSIRRNGTEIAPTERLSLGDEVELEGTAEGFAEAAPRFAASGMVPPARTDSRQRADWIDLEQPLKLVARNGSACGHLAGIREVYPSAAGCEDCLRAGDRWVHLRGCMFCGHIGCCDSSPNRHARKHFEASSHAIMRSMERGENWGWCFVDEVEL
jgi:CPA2 family monovalent cation:H+ antiporter-2